MAELEINSANAETEGPKLIDGIQAIIDDGGTARVKYTKKSNGTLSLDRHWRALMAQSAEIMRSYGVTMRFQSKKGLGAFERPFTPEDAHDLFTYQFMPIGEDGQRKSWSKAGRDGMEVADTGERCRALEQLYAYWLEKGHSLERFRDSEYEKLQEVQNG